VDVTIFHLFSITQMGQISVDVTENYEENVEINQNSVRSLRLLQNSIANKQFHDVQRTIHSVKELNDAMQIRNTRALELVWSNITVTTLDGSKTLLSGATGKIKSRFLAIMGPSGSGKTTLMNTLACRMSNAKMAGNQSLEGISYTNTELKSIAGYVMQDDLLNANLTVYETLYYCAELRLSGKLSKEEKSERIESVIKLLGLASCRDVIIGDALKKGISGGERKRVCVAMELLTQPRLLFLDEPTSGLDSVTAYSLTRTLAELSKAGDCTVICTLHQPQSKIFEMFDDIMLLKAGRVVYYGPTQDAIKFYADAGFPVPPMTNPADHFLDVITPSHHDADKDDNALMGIYQPEPVDIDGRKRLEGYSQLNIHEKPNWMHQFSVLLRRTWVDCTRSYEIIFTLLIQNIVVAFLIGGVFYQIGTGQESMVKRSPALFFTVINQGMFAALSVINSFPSERLLVLRERAAGTYQVSAYFLAKNIVDAILQMPGPIFFSVIVYFMVGFQATAGKFFIFMLFMILGTFSATSFALAISTFARTTSLSVTILPMVLEIFRLFGGFFLAPAKLPKYFAWIDIFSYVKYAYIGISLNELQGLELSCTLPDISKCVSGQSKIIELGLDYITIGGCVGVLVAMIFFFRFIAYLGVRYVKW
jgi:ABC-type multidrug transport system ATPase subunit